MRWWRKSVTRFVLFLTGFVLAAALLLNTGCVTTVEHHIMSNFEKELYDEKETNISETIVGWIPQDKDGYVWEYHARRRGDVIQVVAKCHYAFIKYKGVEKWRGTYYNMLDDQGKEDQFDTFVSTWGTVDGLSGCVNWVEKFLYGDYFI